MRLERSYTDNQQNGRRAMTDIEAYFRDAGEVDLLTREQEVQLGRRIQGRYQLDSRILQSVRRDVVSNSGQEELKFLQTLFSNESNGACLRAKPVTTKYCEVPDIQKEENRLSKYLRKRYGTVPDELRRDLGKITSYVRGDSGIHIPGNTRSCTSKVHEMQTSGLEARNHMICANLRLVNSIAKKLLTQGNLTLDERIQYGNMALFRAAEGFDPCHEKKVKFSTYATWWIKQTIQRGNMEFGSATTVPVYVINLLGQINKRAKQLQNELGYTPTIYEVANDLGIKKKQLGHVFDLIRSNGASSIEATMDNEGEDWISSRGNVITDHRPGPVEIVENAEILRRMRRVLDGDALDEREKVIIEERYALGGGEPRTLKQIGEDLDLTRERIRQIESEAFRKLRNALNE